MTQAERYAGFRNGFEYNAGDGSAADRYFTRQLKKARAKGRVTILQIANPPKASKRRTRRTA